MENEKLREIADIQENELKSIKEKNIFLDIGNFSKFFIFHSNLSILLFEFF
jgi:hypothetical protein